MLYAGIEWPEGWVPGDRHVTSVLGLRVLRKVEPGRAFRVRVPMIREIPTIGADSWVAEYLTTNTTWEIAVCKDPLLACGLCLLYDTTEAERDALYFGSTKPY